MNVLLALALPGDTASVRRLLEHQNDHCSIEETHDGLTALVSLIRCNYDLVVLEAELPILSGLELLRYLRRVGRARPILLAGHTPTFAQARQGILGRVTDFLTLPLEHEADYQLSFAPDNMPEHVDGIRTIEMASQLFSSVAERLLEDGEPEEVRVEKLRLLYRTYVEFAFLHYPWLSNFQDRDSFFKAPSASALPFYQNRLHELTDLIGRVCPRTDAPLLQKVLNYLPANIDQPLRQKDVAAHFFISPSTLSLLFTEHSALVYNNYMFELKLLRAAYLLRFSNKKIQDIAALLGYQDSGYFSAQFKKAFHATPSEYRNAKTKEE